MLKKIKLLAASALALLGLSLPSDISAEEILTEITSGQLASASPGTLRHYKAFSPELKDSLSVDVWLPDEYDPSSSKQYPVVYMHDGQNLFDPAVSFAGVSWEIDQAIDKLSKLGIINTPIIVGIHNRGSKRPSDYIPRKAAFNYIKEEDRKASGIWTLVGNNFNSDLYLEFIAKSLKPSIDDIFPTSPEKENTFVMGSSMGGLISLYAMCEYPDIFGAAACLSTHWIGNFDYDNTTFPEAMLAYMADFLPDSPSHRLYLDRGTEELDSSYAGWEEAARDLAREKGYSEDAGSLYTFTDSGASHSESYWAQRADRPLHFLLASTDEPYIPEEPQSETLNVIFQDKNTNWKEVWAFTWSPGVLQLGGWPGTSMKETTYKGEKAWEITFTHKIHPANIIFHYGSSQTADLEFKNNYVYDFNGPLEERTEDSGINLPVTDDFQFYKEGDMLVLNLSAPRKIDIYSLDGKRAVSSLFPAGRSEISLPKGLYILEGTKIII